MTMRPAWRRYLRFWRANVVGDVDDELRFHIERRVEEYVAQGMTEDSARRLVMERLGDVDAARAECVALGRARVREAQRADFAHGLRDDLRYAFRVMRRGRGFAAAVVLSLALGIGANTAVFSLTNAVFIEPLPVDKPGDLVLLEWLGEPRSSGYSGSMVRSGRPDFVIGASFSVPFFERVQSRTTTLAGVFAFSPMELTVVDRDDARIAGGQLVSGSYYHVLAVRAVHGRTITPTDDRPDAEPVAVITHQYWHRRFAGDSTVVGRRVDINGVATTIIGVTPPRFVGTLDIGDAADVTLPLSFVRLIRPREGLLTNADHWWVQIMGRRKPGVSRQMALAELGPVFHEAVLDRASPRAESRDPRSHAPVPELRVESGERGANDERRDYRFPLMILGIVSGLILAIACVNVAILLLTRATVRQHEIMVRAALGASRSRIVRQLLVEGLVLVTAALGLAVLLALAGTSVLTSLRPSADTLDVALDLRVLGVASALSIASVLLFALFPALRATRVDVASGLATGSRAILATRSPLSRGLITAQIAMAAILLVGSVLFQRTLYNLNTIDVGFDTESLLLFSVDPRLSGYESGRVPTLYRELSEALRAIPGVEGVTFSRDAQLSEGSRTHNVSVLGRDRREGHPILINAVGPGFFETMRLKVLHGRRFALEDDERRPRVAIVNEAMARTMFAGENPIGRRLHLSGSEPEIVGIVTDAKYHHIRQTTEPILYVPYLQYYRSQASFALRTSGPPMAILPLVRDAVRRVDPLLPLFDVQTQRDAVDATTRTERLLTKLATAFAALALILACVGVFAQMSYATSQRVGEIGVRIALGASASNIFWLVSRSTLVLIAIGTSVGLTLATQVARVFTKLLYGLSPTDSVSLIAAAALISCVALVAAFIPARRATRVSPLVAIRQE